MNSKVRVSLYFLTAFAVAYSTGLIFDAAANTEESKIQSLASTGKFDQRWIPFDLDERAEDVNSYIQTFPFGGGPYLFQTAFLSQGNQYLGPAKIDFTISNEQKDDGFFISRVTECIFQNQKDIQTNCVACIIKNELGISIAKGEEFFDPPYRANTALPLEMTQFLFDDPNIVEVSNVKKVLIGICEIPTITGEMGNE